MYSGRKRVLPTVPVEKKEIIQGVADKTPQKRNTKKPDHSEIGEADGTTCCNTRNNYF